jgi:LysR family transcriptional activator of glutamate synthase operon
MKTAMDLAYIREFVALASSLSFSETAEQMHISQSALSRHIQALEKELGEPLFIRSTRKMALSDLGTRLLPFAEDITKSAEQAEQLLSQDRNSILIGTAHNPHLYLITDSIICFCSEYPDIHIRMIEKDLDELQKDFLEHRLSLVTMGFRSGEKIPAPFIQAGISRIAALVPRQHFLADRKVISIHSLSGIPLIIPPENSLLTENLLDCFEREGISMRIIYQGSTQGGIRFLKFHMGIMLADEKEAGQYLADDLVLLPIAEDISYVFGLEYQSRLSVPEQKFVSFIRHLFETPRT